MRFYETQGRSDDKAMSLHMAEKTDMKDCKKSPKSKGKICGQSLMKKIIKC